MSEGAGASPARTYSPIAMSAESTVVAEFAPDEPGDTAYQSESDLERALLTQLEAQAYEYLPITSKADLIDNVRRQLEGLNGIRFSDTEWTTFFSERIASANSGMEDKTIRLQEDHVQLLTRDDGTTKNVRLLDKQHIHNNRLQVINQYETEGASATGVKRATRFDVRSSSTACRWCTSSSSAAVLRSRKRSIRSTDTTERVFGQHPDFLNTFNFL